MTMTSLFCMDSVKIKKMVFIILCSAYLMAACASPSPNDYGASPEPNFAFTFEYGSCNNDILDTFKGTFTKDMIIDPAVTIPFQLTQNQITEIYQKMVEIDLWDYPDVFAIKTPRRGVVGIVTPAMSYRITVRNGEMTKTIFWFDEITDPTTLEAERLRSLFSMMIDMVQNSPEYKKLPVPDAGCV